MLSSPSDTALKLLFDIEQDRFDATEALNGPVVLDRTVLTLLVTHLVRKRLEKDAINELPEQLLTSGRYYLPSCYIYFDVPFDLQSSRWSQRGEEDQLFTQAEFSTLYRDAFFILTTVLPIRIIQVASQSTSSIFDKISDTFISSWNRYNLLDGINYLDSKL